jgi:uncharacterized protein (TIGR03437 family)
MLVCLGQPEMTYRLPACLVALTIGFAAPGQTLTVTTPQPGFEQNLGQYASDVLFALDQRVFYANRVQLVTGLSLQFVNANATVAVTGQAPRGFPLNLYFGSDSKKWLENVPHFKTVHYAQVYPGVDVDFNADRVPGGGTPFVQITVDPGANPAQIVMSLLGDQAVYWYLYSNGLAAYQSVGGSKSTVSVNFVSVNQNSFQPVLGSFDSSLPVVIEFGDPYCSCLNWSRINLESDNSWALAGTYYSSTWQTFVANARADGTPVFLSFFDSVVPGWVVADQKGNVTLAGGLQVGSLSNAPVTPDAPLATPASPRRNSLITDVWVGRFDATGKLVSSTYTGFGNAFALDADGSVYFSTPASVNKWIPGQSHFGFSSPVADVIALATNQQGELAFAANGSAGEYTTAGAVKSNYEGPWTEYFGKLNPISGALLMATFVAVIGSNSSIFAVSASLGLAPGGGLWLASDFSFPAGAVGHTLVAVSGDGTRVLDAEALHGSAEIAFDADGNALVAMVSDFAGSPVTFSAACNSGVNLYFIKRAPDGSLLYATYLQAFSASFILNGPEQLLVDYYSNTFVGISLSPPTHPEIACLISPASRGPLVNLAPGDLVTVLGYEIGPAQASYATFDAKDQLPTQLAGDSVTLNGVAMPLVSAQQGEITFYLPETAPPGNAQLQVQNSGAAVAGPSLYVGADPQFAVFSADGSGSGPVAGVNEDGTLNADIGAPAGSVVSIFGIGTTPPLSVFVESSSGGIVRATVEYSGPAPGLVPGVKQINLRLPAGYAPPRGTSYGRLYISPEPPSPQAVYIRGCVTGLPCNSGF